MICSFKTFCKNNLNERSLYVARQWKAQEVDVRRSDRVRLALQRDEMRREEAERKRSVGIGDFFDASNNATNDVNDS